ncbi:MAG TPA: hypothetical protein ENO25_00145 [Desulfobacteraceae bacterium]|nr:hypothetical protein [Desulfobacteraceae bacterium]
MAIVFDAKGPTFRHEIYEAYKANRPPMPDDMAVQLPPLKQIVRSLGIQSFEMAGYEADDIIGTWARICEAEGLKVVMVTGDKDFRQLVTPDASLWDTMKDQVTSYDSIKAAYGFEPVKFIDVMGLSGDSSDNIPGVPGVGEKTAVRLIQEFGSFEAVFDRVEEITQKKLKENLKSHRDDAFLSRRLVTIDRFVPLRGDIEQLRLGEPSEAELAALFRDLEFRGLWDQFASPHKGDTAYRLCQSMEDLECLAQEIRTAGIVAVDTETTGQDPLQAGLVGISFCCRERERPSISR